MKRHIFLAIAAILFGAFALSAQAPVNRNQSNISDSLMKPEQKIDRKESGKMEKNDGTIAPAKGTGNTDMRTSPERKVSPVRSTVPSTPGTVPDSEVKPITPEASATPKGSDINSRMSTGVKRNPDGSSMPATPSGTTKPQ